MKRKRVKEEEELTSSCCICIENFDSNDDSIELECCNNRLHLSCVMLCQPKNECPLCRCKMMVQQYIAANENKMTRAQRTKVRECIKRTMLSTADQIIQKSRGAFSRFCLKKMMESSGKSLQYLYESNKELYDLEKKVVQEREDRLLAERLQERQPSILFGFAR